MENFSKEMSQKKERVFTAVKILAILLAVALLATGVLVILDVADGKGFSSSSGDEGGDGSSSSYIKPVGGTNMVTVKQGAAVSYASFVTVDDKYAGYQLQWDSSKVDLDTPGKYKVVYKIIDEKGKTLSSYTLTVEVLEVDENMDELMALVEAKANALGLSKDMSKEELVRRIYDFAKSPSLGKHDANIYFSDVSNIPNINRSNWKTDWIKEATLTLKMPRMEGDCYTYYSVSKAFFEYFDIENVGIRRAEGGASSGTHFWNVVNIGTKDAPRWYYYDATRLAGKFSDGTQNSCLITLEKLQSYKSSDGASGFYHFDPTQYPTVETTPLG